MTFDECLNFANTYEKMYGSLHIKLVNGELWLAERVYASVDVEWSYIYGPLADDQAKRLLKHSNVSEW